MGKIGLLLAALLLGTAAQAGGPGETGRDYMKHWTVQGTFEGVKDFVELAITGRGIVINNVAHIGEMLERTGKDIGATKKVYEHAQAIEFCSSTISRDTMEADPHNIVFCPYVIAIYVLADDPGTVHVAYRRPQLVGSPESKASLQAVEDLLDEIVGEALQ